MASISTDRSGNRTVEFLARWDGEAFKRKRRVRLGNVTMRDAEEVKRRVEAILSSKLSGLSPDADTSAWLGKISDDLAAKLAREGLITPRTPKAIEAAATLGAFIDGYIALRHDVKPNTLRVWKQTRSHLVAHFGGGRPLGEISAFDAKSWRLFLMARVDKKGRKLAEASIRKHCGFAKHFFNAAVDKELIARNPFAKLPSASIANDKRQRFITPQEAAKVVEACPDLDWRLIVALSRYGGLRCPSEHLALRWSDVDWDAGRIVVHSPKTEKVGKECRIVPLFPELRPHLEASFDAAAEGTEFVINRYREPDSNMRTTMTKIVKRAGLEPWPRIFHNLRSSRQTELEQRFPTHVVCAWMGNTQAIARKHYLQVTDDHFVEATSPRGEIPGEQPTEIGRNASGEDDDDGIENAETPRNSRGCDDSREVAKVVSGSGWESNPPDALFRRHTGFEARGGHQSRVHSRISRRGQNNRNSNGRLAD